MRRSILVLLAVIAFDFVPDSAARAQRFEPQAAERLVAHPRVREALRLVEASERQTIEEQIALCQIPAPPFGEEERARAFAERLRALGLADVRIDGAGNAIGERPGDAARPLVVLSAHLDTVFPAGTDVTVRREGPVLHGPGIGDDCRGLAVLLAVARALDEAGVSTRGTLAFVGTVGEEGRGNLRGARHLVDEELAGRIDAFVSIDGAGHDLTKDAVGSRRYRVVFTGPGGHSYGDFGMPSPIHAMGRAIARISDIEVPAIPKTTFNVGVVEGGISVNAIAREAAMDVDLRSLDPDVLADLDRDVRAAVEQALTEENARGEQEQRVTVEFVEIGVRPAGTQPDSAPIVQAALAAARELGLETRLEAGSTDANAAIAAGIPAVTMDGGGKGGGSHSPSEWFDTTDSHLGTQWALLFALALVGVEDPAAD
jgi:tripeptide aminopeptidase